MRRRLNTVGALLQYTFLHFGVKNPRLDGLIWLIYQASRVWVENIVLNVDTMKFSKQFNDLPSILPATNHLVAKIARNGALSFIVEVRILFVEDYHNELDLSTSGITYQTTRKLVIGEPRWVMESLVGSNRHTYRRHDNFRLGTITRQTWDHLEYDHRPEVRCSFLRLGA
jgi:hypothetical protein